jgi:hypothetical protein
MIKFKPLPPLERLTELLEVVEIPEDKYGVWSGLVWKVRRGGKATAGSVAGYLDPAPTNPDRVNWKMGIDGNYYVVSRVIYYMKYGGDPGNVQVDHKDQNWLNNNAWNLRLDSDGSVQNVNTPKRRDNTSSVVGVSWRKDLRKWQAYVHVKGKLNYLGCYICKREAARAVRDRWIELGWHKKGRKLPDLNKIQCACGACKR